MKMLTLESMHLRNFKALRDSGEVTFTPLTVFIGNNGSGKSSLIEGLQTYQDIVLNDLDAAMNRWHAFEYIHNPPLQLIEHGRGASAAIEPIEFQLSGNSSVLGGSYRLSMTLTRDSDSDKVIIERENLDADSTNILQRDQSGQTQYYRPVQWNPLPLGLSIMSPAVLARYNQIYESSFLSQTVQKIVSWQFLTLNPYTMGDPKPQKRSGGAIRLESDGSNIAEYLLDIRKRDEGVFDEIIETLHYVLPYAEDLQPALTSELERDVYLQLTEGKSKIAGWLLSTGTLRLLALLAVLKNPELPPLIVIEEIENGLDPRTINLIVEEMRSITESGTSQIIATTHSPYLLDLLDLEQIVVVERTDGQPTFFRPSTDEALQKWAESFTPGRLYTMSQLTRRSAE